MASIIQETKPYTFAKLLPMMARMLPDHLIDDVLDTHAAREKRHRDLPAHMIIALCILMNLDPRANLQVILQRLLVAPSLFLPLSSIRLPSRSAISQARYRLGAKPLHTLFRRVCRPLATPDMPWAYRYGLHLVSLDSTIETVADTPHNAHYFGRSSGQYGDSAFPNLRAVYLCECGTHAIFDACLAPYHSSDRYLAWRLLRSITADMLVLFDAGFTSFDMLYAIIKRQSHVLCTAHATSKLKPLRRLADGSYLSEMHATDKSKTAKNQSICVRVICYYVQDPNCPYQRKKRRLVTTLLDPELYPALELVTLYHERWEIELVIDELDTHQRLPHRPFRSQKPVGVIQEFYALLLAHFLVRSWMLESGQCHNLDPDQLSFTFSLICLRDALPYFQLFPDCTDYLCDWLRTWMIQVQLPERVLRWNPRVIKRQRFKFTRKEPEHLAPPKPTLAFQASIVLT